MKQIKAVIQSFMLEKVLDALAEIDGLPGLTIADVRGWGLNRAATPSPVGGGGPGLAQECVVEIVVADAMAARVVDAIVAAARTGHPSDGKVFVVDVEDAVRIQTGARGEAGI